MGFYSGTPSRIRTYDQLIKSQLLYQLSYGRIRKVHSAGFEPATNRLEGGCSIQLSYECIYYVSNGIEISLQ